MVRRCAPRLADPVVPARAERLARQQDTVQHILGLAGLGITVVGVICSRRCTIVDERVGAIIVQICSQNIVGV